MDDAVFHPSVHARTRPGHSAHKMAGSGAALTCRELDERSNQGAQLFRLMGPLHGDHVAILMENGLPFLEVCRAAQRCGLDYTAISRHLTADEARYVVAVLQLTDRKAYMIFSGGVNIYPQEAEDVLVGHPSVMDAAVFGGPDEEMGEQVKAVIKPVDMAEAGHALEARLIAFCRERLSPIKCPRRVDFEAELPRAPTGKLIKRHLRDRYWPERV